MDVIQTNTFFPQLHTHLTLVMLGSTIFDNPRYIIHASIKLNDGLLLACLDNLGRVQLINVSTKQVIQYQVFLSTNEGEEVCCQGVNS